MSEKLQSAYLLFLTAELLLLETDALARKLLRKDRGVPVGSINLSINLKRSPDTYWVSELTVLESFSVRYVS